MILSSSLDGTVKLWHIASSSCLYTFTFGNSGVTCIKLLECPWLNSSKPRKEDPELDLTRNKLLLIGTSNGYIYGHDVFDKTLLFSLNVPENIRVASLDCSLKFKKIWAGLENGILTMISLDENFKVEIDSLYQRSKSPLFVSHVPCQNSSSLWLSSSDGSCALWSFEESQILKELAVSSVQSSCVYGFTQGMIVCCGSLGIFYGVKMN